MAQKIKTTQEQRDKVLQLLIANKYQEANAVAQFLGFREGITAEFFEYVISKDHLHMQVIEALAVYYAQETLKVRTAALGVQ